MNDYILKEMERLHADGVDFIDLSPVNPDNLGFPKVYASYTKEEISSIEALPRAGKVYWKMVKGKKKIIK